MRELKQRSEEHIERRPLATRDTALAHRASAWLASFGVRPNAVSLASVAAAGLAAAALVAGPSPLGVRTSLVLAAVFVQLRLLCNLLDGMLAVELGLRSPVGELYNDVPDRVSDALILVAAGYAASALGEPSPLAPVLGWLCALLASGTAYVRLLGAACGTPQYFAGPMAKQHRMACVTIAALAGAFLPAHAGRLMLIALGLVAVGSLLTAAVRLRRIARALRGGAR